MKKDALISIIICIVLTSVLVAADETAQIDKAYDCLNNEVRDSGSLTLDESIFSMLALGNKDKLNNILNNEKSSEACWPKSGCKLKETAQVAIAYDRIGKETNDTISWLLTKKGISAELIWYLQIMTQNNEADTCSARYGGGDYSVTIDGQMKLTGSLGNCLNVDGSGYRIKISENCLEKEFSISCSKDFKTNLLYEESSGGTIFVSSETHAAAAKATTTEQVKAKCFKTGNSCDYEGSLWAVTALYATGQETEEFVPYLIALSEKNQKYFPSAFLKYITGRADQYDAIWQIQKSGGYWEMENSPYGKYYDTSLGMLALGEQASEAKAYLLEPGKQTEDGCWNNNHIRDTAFILYAGWPKTFGGGGGDGEEKESANCTNGKIEDDEVCECGNDKTCGNKDDDLNNKTCESKGFDSGNLTCGNGCKEFNTTNCKDIGGGLPLLKDCESAGYFCGERFGCLDSGGRILSDSEYACTSFTEICCTTNPRSALEICGNLGGEICQFGKTCSGSSVEASDGRCCIGTCVVTEDEENVCGDVYDGTCKTSCEDSEEEVTADCPDTEDVCCVGKTSNGTGANGRTSSLWTWIVVLIILIVLVVIGILFRNNLRVWWFKFRGKAKSSRIGMGPSPGERFVPRITPSFIGMRRPQIMRERPRAAPSKELSEKEKEMDETLNKLKKMSE